MVGPGALGRWKDTQVRAIVLQVQFLTVLLGFDQNADGGFRLPHQVQIHLFVVWHVDCVLSLDDMSIIAYNDMTLL